MAKKSVGHRAQGREREEWNEALFGLGNKFPLRTKERGKLNTNDVYYK